MDKYKFDYAQNDDSKDTKDYQNKSLNTTNKSNKHTDLKFDNKVS